MLHFVWTVDWKEETTHATALAYILNLTSQENKIVSRARHLCLDTVSQHTLPWSSEARQRHSAACDTVPAVSWKSSLFITPLLVYLVGHTPAWKNLHNSPHAYSQGCVYRQPAFLVPNPNCAPVRILSYPWGKAASLSGIPEHPLCIHIPAPQEPVCS